MVIKIDGQLYRIDGALIDSAKNTVQEILNRVKIESEKMPTDDYYTAFVLAMYVTSSLLLPHLTPGLSE